MAMYSDVNFYAGEQSLSELVYDGDAVRQSLLMIFRTKRGDRLFRPELGCDLSRYLFSPITEDNKSRLENELRYGVSQEPRATLNTLNVIIDMSLPGYKCAVFVYIPAIGQSTSLNFLLKQRL